MSIFNGFSTIFKDSLAMFVDFQSKLLIFPVQCQSLEANNLSHRNSIQFARITQFKSLESLNFTAKCHNQSITHNQPCKNCHKHGNKWHICKKVSLITAKRPIIRLMVMVIRWPRLDVFECLRIDWFDVGHYWNSSIWYNDSILRVRHQSRSKTRRT